MIDLSGTHGVIVGVANKRSLAWAIAQAMDAVGAQLTLSYATERFEANVRKLGATLRQPPLIVPCDVTSDAQVRDLFAAVERECGGLDFLVHAVGFASREALSEPFLQTSREDFLQAFDISAYSLVALARAAAPLMERRGGGSILTLTYLGSQRVFPNYNVMGVAKAALEAVVRYLASDLGSRNIRVNAVSAGPIKTPVAARSNRRRRGGCRGGQVSPGSGRARGHRRGLGGRRRVPQHRHVSAMVRRPNAGVLTMRRTRGVLLRVARSRTPALVVGLVLLAPATVIAVGDYGWESWLTDGLGLIGGATGAALVLTGLAGRRADWIDPDDPISR